MLLRFVEILSLFDITQSVAGLGSAIRTQQRLGGIRNIRNLEPIVLPVRPGPISVLSGRRTRANASNSARHVLSELLQEQNMPPASNGFHYGEFP